MRELQDKAAIIFWIALAVCLIAPWLPFGRVLLWPLSMLGVYVHELFHGLTAIATGGYFHDMMIDTDFGGVANIATREGLPSALASAGGLIGPALVGAFLIILSRRYLASKLALSVLAGFLVLSALIWAADLFTFAFCAGFGAAVIAAALIPHQLVRNAIAQVIGVQLGLENLIDFHYMFTDGFFNGGVYHVSDTGNIADQIGGTYYIWGTLIGAATIAILIGTFILSSPQRPARRQ